MSLYQRNQVPRVVPVSEHPYLTQKRDVSADDVLVVVASRTAWRLLDYCLTNYLALCQKAGINQVNGVPIDEALIELGKISRVNPKGKDVSEACEALVKAYKKGTVKDG